ncbi:hypothetical protein XENOCAPTIV_019703 [Xenoophorus captivus]|uniref:Dynein heavy chain tail domain-containing protein n=1 Tax=Xenoophorus captivus TaxID=1517983 RepID=A0ABV0S5G2_9TELE
MTTGGAGGVRVPQEPSLKAGVLLSDERVDFLREQAFCVLRVKTDKWNRFIAAEENQKIILDFLDHIWMNRLLLFTGPGGTLHAGDVQVRNAHMQQIKQHQFTLGEVPGCPMEHLPSSKVEQIKDILQRVKSSYYSAFEDICVKLLKIFGSLLERPRIQELFSPNYNVLLAMFNQEIDHCQVILDQHREMLQSGCAVLGKNMPSMAGNLKWSQELRSRILTNRSNFCQLPHMPLGCAEADEVLRKCEHVLEMLEKHDEELLTEWTEGLEDVCQMHLKEPLLTLDTYTGLFQVNFSLALTSVLREVKYLSILKIQNIPKTALHLYSKQERLYLNFFFTVIQENQSLLDVSDQISGEWSAYTEYVDRMIVTGFVNAVRCSLQYFMDNTDATQRITPLFEIKLILNGNEMTFDPSLDLSVSGNLYNIMDKMVTNIAGMASFIPRVARHKQLDNYQINLFESLYVRVSKMEDRMVFCGWLQLDIRPFKHTLLNVIKREQFRTESVFKINVEEPYKLIDKVQLQNILMSKYVEYFQAEVSGWQRKLMVADLVISSWMSVQRTWAHLNSIFTNSDDIRCQLANDAERFQGIHTDFQVNIQPNTLPYFSLYETPSYLYILFWLLV